MPAPFKRFKTFLQERTMPCSYMAVNLDMARCYEKQPTPEVLVKQRVKDE